MKHTWCEGWEASNNVSIDKYPGPTVVNIRTGKKNILENVHVT